ncbi:Ribonuclease H-like protein [Mycena indigotica]|uniref:ribonuclease H n=1 Tax=Mycena indigotica TaxID=2126181 RepID=A0A8H6SGN7_9AGAR|nr:Ribonuclease H-like protein [Mycena indigotica]KAF7298613.1 Ribonuclease H-like protein [Mycena indigotica]
MLPLLSATVNLERLQYKPDYLWDAEPEIAATPIVLHQLRTLIGHADDAGSLLPWLTLPALRTLSLRVSEIGATRLHNLAERSGLPGNRGFRELTIHSTLANLRRILPSLQSGLEVLTVPSLACTSEELDVFLVDMRKDGAILPALAKLHMPFLAAAVDVRLGSVLQLLKSRSDPSVKGRAVAVPITSFLLDFEYDTAAEEQRWDMEYNLEAIHKLMSLPTDRAFVFCPSNSHRPLSELLVSCPHSSGCGAFLAKCCNCFVYDKLCHTFELVFVDGACPGNGSPHARAGIGCAIGTRLDQQLSLPVTDEMDPGQRRTSQRAELLAALIGLEFLLESRKDSRGRRGDDDSSPDARNHRYIVVADSEYVVKGMTEWVPQWKANNWKNKHGRTPANVDLFQQIEAILLNHKNRSYAIQFYHVPRQFNALADRLAKEGAEQ